MSMSNHLIIIDEDRLLANGIARALRSDFDRISVLQNPLGAGELIQDSGECVIISEIRFSTVDGTAMLCELKKSFPQSRIIALSAYYSEQTVRALQKAGVTHVLEKPVKTEHLKNEIETFISH